jgi:2OG-Fe(II) oxygenase superfamily
MGTDHARVPANFLPPAAPEGACLRRLDFTHTDPPLLMYKGLFAAVIDNVFTESECKTILEIAEASTIPPESPNTTPTWERAMINVGGGRQLLITDSRNCGRIIYDSPPLAQRLLDRLLPFLKECGIDRLQDRPEITGSGPAMRGEVCQLSRINERLRFLKYEGGEYFKPHCDGMYITPDGQERSYITIHLYLNGDGEQDMTELTRGIEKAKGQGRAAVAKSPDGSSETLLGGATSFMSTSRSQGGVVRIFPKTGSILVFQHRDLLHAGDDVFRGVKYTMRTDIMYRASKLS